MATAIVTRRRFLAAVAGFVPLVYGGRVSAFPYEKVPDHDSKDEFKRDCANLGGTFDVGQYSTSCTYRDGDIKVCDENGKNCTYHESADAPAPGPFGGPLGSLDPLPVLTEQPLPTDSVSAKGNGKGKGKKGGKRRKR